MQYGQPLQMLDMGETALDEETFNDYLQEMRTHYTADKVRPFPVADFIQTAQLVV